MDSLSDFPILYSKDFKLPESITDEQLQDVCTIIRGRIMRLVKQDPVVSIVFPAHNEELYLPLMLWSLSKLTTEVSVEVIGVNNASTDRTGEIMKQCGIEIVDENQKGTSYARQAGLEAARGKYIATTDADTQVPERWIDEYLRCFDNNPDLVCLSGGLSVGNPHFSRYFIRLIPKIIRHILGKDAIIQPYFVGANTFYLREMALQLGGYDPGYDLGEDDILGQKFKQRGEVLAIGEKDSPTTVTTSNRRMNSLTKVLYTYGTNAFRTNWLNRDTQIVTTGRTFSDIR